MIDYIFDTLAPHYCSACGQNGVILCNSCEENIINEPYESCLRCARPCSNRGLCKACVRLLPFDQVWAVGERRIELKALLDGYKFRSERAAAPTMARLLDRTLPLLPTEVTVVGIPTSARTMRVRGFDHVGLIVKEFAKLRGLSVATPLVRENMATLHFLGLTERQTLAPTLFSLRPGSVPKTVLLVDDILTTGTTLGVAASLLRQAGVEQLYGVVIARQPLDM